MLICKLAIGPIKLLVPNIPVDVFLSVNYRYSQSSGSDSGSEAENGKCSD